MHGPPASFFSTERDGINRHAPLLPAAALAGSAGVLITLSLPRFSLTPVTFVALTPLLVAIAGCSMRRAFLLGWLAGAVAYVGACSWVLPAIARFERIWPVLALPFFSIFVLYHGLQLALFAAGMAWIFRADFPRPGAPQSVATPDSTLLFTASWWVILEWAFPKMLPWYFSLPLAESPLLRQAADLGGVYGLSFMLVLVNAAVASALLQRHTPLLWRLRPVAVAGAIVGAVALYGLVRISGNVRHVRTSAGEGYSPELASAPQPASESAVDTALTVLVVQGGLSSGADHVSEANEVAWTTYTRLTTESWPSTRTNHERHPDLIVWPETVLRVYLWENDRYRQRVVDFVRHAGRPLFVGSLELLPGGAGELNSGYLIEPDAPKPQVYRKHHLLPFGEYTPAVSLLPFLAYWQTTGKFVSGKNAAPLTLSVFADDTLTDLPSRRSISSHSPRLGQLRAAPAAVTSFAPSICVEAMLPGAYNQLVRRGAEFLVNITDDGWFDDTAAPDQHLQATTLRAVETHRWLVRASNSGVSAVIDPTGEVVASLPVGTIGALRHQITRSRNQSVYVRFGNWPVPLCIAYALWTAIGRVSSFRLGTARRCRAQDWNVGL